MYREARAQEVTEWLYRHQDSPWNHRINMLQGKGEPRVSQWFKFTLAPVSKVDDDIGNLPQLAG